ncbi:peptide deformylase [Desulfitobacterium dichloroeliminans LMG P-21439]|uniref:Peptide deformylase n=1 Tax=Desulfitobacterium dichloroeliminans (strain LMG P-21439 / DCA1) TaxID=871963 RepID=L0F8K7_DESDL|nr:peptide deformylase [Desulfitobacterium dichloroeliminans]AGA70154.1 peptide deformylase [Desulfitobacterium dichloroeliminans LMG P-21439]
MAIYQIVEIGSDVLREKAVPVKEITPNIVKLLDNMLDTLYDAEGVGLAAPQVGVSKRVVVVDVGDGPIELINPVFLETEGEDIDDEGCLSIPGVTGQVKRAAKVKVEALNRKGELQVIEGTGLLARCLQHEVDHLEGVLFVDKAAKTHRR